MVFFMMARVMRMEIQHAIMPGLVSENQFIGIDRLISRLRMWGPLVQCARPFIRRALLCGIVRTRIRSEQKINQPRELIMKCVFLRRAMLVTAAAGVSLLAACGGGGGGGGTASTVSAGNTSTVTTGTGPVTSTLSGTVTSKSGAPVAGVTVSVFHHNDHTTKTAITDANGMYAVPGLDTGANSDYAIYAEKSGYGIYPAMTDASGAVGKFDFNGYYRTVIRIPTVPARNVSGANFTVYGPSDKVASLPRTGQTVSYASGDDFSAQKGVAWPSTRFTDNSNGTVTDRLTGLVWMKNAGCFTPTNWSAALTAANQLASGACGLTDGSVAGQWRMPNANELESMVDVSRANPAVSAGSSFTNIALGNAYWSSTTYTALWTNAMAIRFTDGRWINGADPAAVGFNNDKATSNNSLWAVRSGGAGLVQLLATGVFPGQGGATYGTGDDANLQFGAPLTSPRFIDNGNGTLIDTVSGLTWLKKADCVQASWSGALAAVNSLASGQCGLTDGSTAGQWRMPNRQEMLSLSDRAPTFPQASYFNGQYQGTSTINGPVIFNNFIVSDYYWTSTTNAADIAQAWTIYSCDFGVYNIVKTDAHYALAVR
jgi:hypothetical protein